MSDLHCPARILLAGPGEQLALDRSLLDARLALVYTGPSRRTVRTAEAVAARTGVPVVVRDDLHGEAVPAELSALADLHRGETVLVVLPGAAIRSVVTALVALPDGRLASRLPVGDAVVELAADADGWVLRSPVDQPGGVETVDG